MERYNVSLPDLAMYKRRDYIDAIKKHQRQFRNLLSKDYYSLLKTAQNNNLNVVGTGKKGRVLKINLIDAIKTYISPERFRVDDFRGITSFQGNFKNWELLPRMFTDDPV